MIFSGDKTMRNLRSRLVPAIARVFVFLCPHAGQAHTFLKLKKYAKKFCRKAPASSAMTYFFEIKKVCKKILPQGSGFLGNAKRKLNHINFFNFRFGRLCFLVNSG